MRLSGSPIELVNENGSKRLLTVLNTGRLDLFMNDSDVNNAHLGASSSQSRVSKCTRTCS